MKIRISCLEAIFIYSLVLTIILYWCIPIKSLFNFFVRVKTMSNSYNRQNISLLISFLQSIICSFKIVDIIGKIFSKDIFGLQTQEGVLTFSSFIYKTKNQIYFTTIFTHTFLCHNAEQCFTLEKVGFALVLLIKQTRKHDILE